jgi:nucleoside-diphosphate-sugar epimerase
MKYFVTGITGFAASHLAHLLIKLPGLKGVGKREDTELYRPIDIVLNFRHHQASKADLMGACHSDRGTYEVSSKLLG